MFEVNTNLNIEIKKLYDHAKNDYGYMWRKVFIIDDFYKNPDEVRDLALNFEPKSDKKYCGNLIGKRVVEDVEDFSKLRDSFKTLCQYKDWYNLTYDHQEFDEKWDRSKFMVNITTGDEIDQRFNEKMHTYTFHIDGVDSKWAALVYLNKDDECQGGTNFYSWKGDPSSKPRLEYTAEMKYNRMVLYEANQMHGAIMESGMFKEFPRITQVFFM